MIPLTIDLTHFEPTLTAAEAILQAHQTAIDATSKTGLATATVAV